MSKTLGEIKATTAKKMFEDGAFRQVVTRHKLQRLIHSLEDQGYLLEKLTDNMPASTERNLLTYLRDKILSLTNFATEGLEVLK